MYCVAVQYTDMAEDTSTAGGVVFSQMRVKCLVSGAGHVHHQLLLPSRQVTSRRRRQDQTRVWKTIYARSSIFQQHPSTANCAHC